MLLHEVKWRFHNVQTVVSGAVLHYQVKHIYREFAFSQYPFVADGLARPVERGFEAVIVNSPKPSHSNRQQSLTEMILCSTRCSVQRARQGRMKLWWCAK